MSTSRRDFLKTSLMTGAAIGLSNIPAIGSDLDALRVPSTKNKNVVGLACEPLNKVRIGFIGLGMRGPDAVDRMMKIEGVEIDTEGLVEAKALSEEEAVLTEEETEEVIKQETILEKQELIKDVEIPAGVMEEVAPAVTETAAGSRRAEEKTTVGKVAEIIAEKKEKPKEVAIDIPTPKEAVITDEPIVEDGETFYAETPKETAIGRLEKFDEKTEIKSLSESYISNLNSMPDSVSANLIQQLPREQKIEALQRLTLTEKKVEMIESLPSDDKISVLEKQEINDIAISIIKDLSKDERQKLISRLPLEKQIKLKNMLSGLIPTGAAVFEPGEISDEELRIDLAEDYAAGEKVLSCIKSTEKSDTQTVNIAASSSAVDMPEGFEQVIEPFKVSCIVNKTKISFNIPSRYEDLKIVECKGSSCSTKPVNEVEELTCGKKIKEVERKKDSFDVNDFPIKVQGMITQVTPGKNIVMSGRSKISFAGNIVADVILSKPKNSIKQPHNPKLKIMSTPLIALINSSSKDIGADITIPYADSEFIVKDSLAIYYWKNSQWNFLGGKIDYKARTVTAQVANISGVSEKNTLFVSVIGVLCTNCVESKLTKIFVPEKYTDKAVLLVHGFASSSKTYQQIVDDFRLTQQPYKVYIFDYLQNKSLDEIALELAILLEAKSDEFNELSIIGHSLGGLLAQRLVYLAEKANEELPGSYTFLPTIKRSFIIGAPNLGSPLARDYQKLFGILANKASEFSLLKVDSAIISILANGIITPRVKGIEYLVMAGTRDYELNLLLFQTSVSKYFPGLSDGVVGVNSARMVGEAYVPDLCSDYYEINVTHTDLLHKEESRQVIEKIITKAQESDIKAGQNKYIEIVIENCSPKIDYTIIGKVQHKQKQLDPTGCSCGNGFCGEGEDEVNCPSDCLNIVTKDSFCGVKKPVMMLFIIIIVMMLLLNIIIFSWKKRFPLTTTLIALASASLLAGVFIAGTIICDPKCSYIAEKIQLIIWALYFVSFFFVIASKITFHLPHGSLRTKLRILQSIISVLIIAAALIFVRAQIIILLLLALLSIISLYYSVKPEHISIASISRYAIRKTPSIKHWKIMLMVVVGIIASIIIAIIAQYVITKVSLSIPEKLPEFMPLLSESSLDEALSGLADITLGAIILLAVILFNEMLRRIKPPVQKPYEPAAPIAPEQPQKTLPKSVKCPLSIRLFLLKIRLQKIFGVYRGIGQLEYEIKARLGIWKPGSYPPSSGLNQRIFSIKIRLKKIFGIYISIEDLERLIKGRLERQKKK